MCAADTRDVEDTGRAPIEPQVLVVDDYADTRELLSLFFAHAGYGVLLADNGRDALALARQHHPAAIVMDIFMPGMDGIQATEALRAEPDLARIPVIAHTARPRSLDETADLFDNVCVKPCPPELLLDLVQTAVRDRAQRSS